MAPKPQVAKKPTGVKQSATSKVVDDFLKQSTVPAGHLERIENEKKQREKMKELNEKYMNLISPTSVQLNLDAINRCRVISNIFAGMTAGILGHGAGLGALWWFGLNAAVGLLIYLKVVMMGFEDNGQSKYF